MRTLSRLIFACFFSIPFAGQVAAETPSGGPDWLKGLKFRSIGPAAGGRVCRAVGVPGDPLTYYAATAAGGLWKTENGGHDWKPVLDDQPVSSCGSLAIAPSDSNVIYVGSGEANIRGNMEVGNGIFKSTDAGKTWKHVWKQEGQIGTMIVHPKNPDIAFAAVLGKAFGPNPERGVYRTMDGGKTWTRVLYRNPDAGASDVRFDPANPRILYAGLWQTRRKPWEMTSGGPGSGLFTSTDGGDTWTELVPAPKDDSPESDEKTPKGKRRCAGLPAGVWGKVCLAVAPSNPARVYALIEAEKGGLFRSDDGGKKWALVNDSRALRQRAWYFSTLTVNPKNADEIWFPQVPLLKSIDGGKNLQRVKGPHHGDHHDIWIDPTNPRRMINSNDGGVDITTDGGKTWFAPPLPIAQFYHVSADNRRPYWVSGCMQDLGAVQGPSDSLSSGGIPLSAWHSIGGGEAGHTCSDSADPNIVYATEYGGILTRYDHRKKSAETIGGYPYNASGHAAKDLKFRFQWTAPVLVSRHDPKVVYHAANVLFRTDNAGKNWTAVSKDLTRNDKNKQKWSGGPITGDNTGVEVYGTIFALAESPIKKGVLWAGSDDGLVHVTQDGGENWTNVTDAIKGLPEWGTVSSIEASPFDAGTAYVVVDAHRIDDRKPYLFGTTDFGKTWNNLTEKMPATGYLTSVREDPAKKGILYVGTERGVLLSKDAGKTWAPLKLNLPPVRVTDLVVKDGDLVVGTNGRSLWILDDLTPVRAIDPEEKNRPTQLFQPRTAGRIRPAASVAEKAAKGTADNPPLGAVLHYFLANRPKSEITLEVLDATGHVVRTLSSKPEPAEDEDPGSYSSEEPKKPALSKVPGLHRVVWDLRGEGAKPIKSARVDSGSPRRGPLLGPGIYKVKLLVDGNEFTSDLRVVESPWKERADTGDKPQRGEPINTNSDLAARLALAKEVRDDITRLSTIVERLRRIKSQITARNELLKSRKESAALVKESNALAKKLDALEGRLHNSKAKVSYDILAQPGGAQLYSQLIWIYEQLNDGDSATPQGLRDQASEQHTRLKALEKEWQSLVTENAVRLNDKAKALKVPELLLPKMGIKAIKESK
jgi:photosystem II stability/assembly factor-like uncharacterized protein